jgi:hypothetical protein
LRRRESGLVEGHGIRRAPGKGRPMKGKDRHYGKQDGGTAAQHVSILY